MLALSTFSYAIGKADLSSTYTLTMRASINRLHMQTTSHESRPNTPIERLCLHSLIHFPNPSTSNAKSLSLRDSTPKQQHFAPLII